MNNLSRSGGSMFELHQTYTLPGHGCIYVAETLPDGRLFLRDLNRSYFWHCGRGSRQGWAEGFLGTGAGEQRGRGSEGPGHAMEPYWYEVADGAPPMLERVVVGRVRLEGEFVRCGLERRVVSIEEWLGIDN